MFGPSRDNVSPFLLELAACSICDYMNSAGALLGGEPWIVSCLVKLGVLCKVQTYGEPASYRESRKVDRAARGAPPRRCCLASRERTDAPSSASTWPDVACSAERTDSARNSPNHRGSRRPAGAFPCGGSRARCIVLADAARARLLAAAPARCCAILICCMVQVSCAAQAEFEYLSLLVFFTLCFGVRRDRYRRRCGLVVGALAPVSGSHT
jgi:hypothetical protein